jgi:hypothetical protein
MPSTQSCRCFLRREEAFSSLFLHHVPQPFEEIESKCFGTIIISYVYTTTLLLLQDSIINIWLYPEKATFLRHLIWLFCSATLFLLLLQHFFHPEKRDLLKWSSSLCDVISYNCVHNCHAMFFPWKLGMSVIVVSPTPIYTEKASATWVAWDSG